MNNLLFGIILSALLSSMSFLIVLLRVSPLNVPVQAVPAFFVTVVLTVVTVSTLMFYGLWNVIPVHTWDRGRLLAISLRQGIFLGSGTLILLVFHLLGLLTWWIAVMIYAVFLLVELALDH